MEDSELKNLSETFADGWKKFREISNSEENTTSPSLQAAVKECQKLLIQCTLMVNQLALFSSNETIEEVSTENIKFLLLPVFLGELSLKTTSIERQQAVTNAKIYIHDFLKRCYDYQLTKVDPTDTSKNDGAAHRRENKREEKIQRFKQNKEINGKIEILEKRLKISTVDESTMREYYLAWLRLWINNSIENMAMLESEMEILQHIKNIDSGKVKPPSPVKNKQPMKPMLITREMVKNQVFGAGYRSLPTMSEEEYFQKEIREGKIVQEYSNEPGKIGEKTEEEKEEEEEEDEEKLKKARDWDDWKDTHRRGEGNKERHG